MQKRMPARFTIRRWILPLTVAFVCTLVTLYYGFWASDVYTSESRFVVRSPDRQVKGGLAGIVQGIGFGKTQDDSRTVREYVLSRDALRILVDRVGIKDAYASSEVDVFSRFAGLDGDNSFEALYRFWQKQVDVQTDADSSIVTLSVKAFGPKEAQTANQILLEQSEALVNRLNERGRNDLVQYAKAETARAEKAAKDATIALASFRSRQKVVDPDRQATVQLQQIAKLQDELIATNLQLAQVQSYAPANPQISSLQLRSETLRKEIANEIARIAGSESSLVNKSAGMQQLVLDVEFSSKQLASALASLESARNEALRQQVYIERIAQPSLPDVAQQPRRLRSILATWLFGLVVFGILKLLAAGVREHSD